MAITINDIDGFDSLLEDDENLSPQELQQSSFEDKALSAADIEDVDGIAETPAEPEPAPEQEQETSTEEPLMYAYLKSLGIADPDKLAFEGDDGEIEERSFTELTREEQLNVLKELNATEPVDGLSGLSKEELEYVNFARQNNVTMEQMMKNYAEQYLQNYLTTNNLNVPDSIDNYSDDQLYLSDLAAKYPSFTDEELASKLEAAKQNEELFTKEVTELRNYYKAQEQEFAKKQEEQKQAEAAELQTTIVNAVKNFNGVYLDYTDEQSDSIEIEDADKEDIYAYLTSQGPDGLSQFAKDLQNPDTLVEMAWFRTKGADVLSNVTRYWKDEVAKAHRENSRLQKELDKYTKNNDKSVVVPHIAKKAERPSIASIWDKF